MLKRGSKDRTFEAVCEGCGAVLEIEGAFSSTAHLRLMREGWHIGRNDATWCGDCQPTQARGESRSRQPGGSDV